MKKVHRGAQVAHLWAHAAQSEAYIASRNFRFSDGTSNDSALYSYSTTIARRIQTPHCLVFLVSANRYSHTTSRQLSEVGRAIRDLGSHTFTVSHLNRFAGDNHKSNARELVDNYRLRVKCELARVKWYGVELERNYSELPRLQASFYEAQKYATIFDQPLPIIDVVGDAQRIDNRRNRLVHSPEATAKRAQRELDCALANEAARILRQAEMAKARADAAVAIEAWKRGNGSSYALPYDARTDADGSALLRVNPLTATLETSLGAEVPHRDAWALVVWMRKDKTPRMLVNGPKVGPFQLNTFVENGVRIGCHFITWTEIDRVFPIEVQS